MGGGGVRQTDRDRRPGNKRDIQTNNNNNKNGMCFNVYTCVHTNYDVHMPVNVNECVPVNAHDCAGVPVIRSKVKPNPIHPKNLTLSFPILSALAAHVCIIISAL